MKTIHVGFIGFWGGFDPYTFLPIRLLAQRFNVAISDEPDFVFCSIFGRPYQYCRSDAVRILCSGENFSPDFNVFDYSIGFDRRNYADRHFRLPYGIWDENLAELAGRKHLELDFAHRWPRGRFCNFIYGHAASPRDRIFDLLESYRRVDSPGRWRNNRPDGIVAANWTEKLQFQRECKFSIAVEATSLKGFWTEKIVHAFAAGTVPIYFGDPEIARDFNEQAFVNFHSYPTFEQAVQRVIELDRDESALIEMLAQPAFVDAEQPAKVYEALSDFLTNIFDQPAEDAYRRSREYAPRRHDTRLAELPLYEASFRALPKPLQSMQRRIQTTRGR